MSSGPGRGGTGESLVAVSSPEESERKPTTRRAPRVPIKPNVGVLIDGKEAVLVDLSVFGAQVLSPTVIRPNKPVRVVMPDREALVKVNGVIVWARFEMLHGRPTPQYRAGISFTDPDPEAVVRYCDRLRV
jgi:hypothetical protein